MDKINTVGLVAKKLNPEYIEMAEKRIRGKMGLFVRSSGGKK